MGTSTTDEVRRIATRVREDHRSLERALDELCAWSARLRLGAIPKRHVEDAIFRLFLQLDDHDLMEERLLAPLLPRLDPDTAARVELMLHEHDLQRGLLLSSLELTEPGTLTAAELIVVSKRIVRALRADIALEEELFSDLSTDWGQSSASAR